MSGISNVYKCDDVVYAMAVSRCIPAAEYMDLGDFLRDGSVDDCSGERTNASDDARVGISYCYSSHMSG